MAQNLDEITFRSLAEVIFFLSSLPSELVKNIAVLCNQSNLTKSNRKYMISIIVLR